MYGIIFQGTGGCEVWMVDDLCLFSWLVITNKGQHIIVCGSHSVLPTLTSQCFGIVG